MSLADQAIRMLRTKWGSSVDLIAQELYEILRTDTDPQSGPITVNLGNGQHPIQLPANFLTNPFGQFTIPDLSLPNFGINPFDLGNFDNQQNQQPSPDDPAPLKTGKRTKEITGFQRVTMVAQVVSGSGSTYQVLGYPIGTGGDPVELTINQLQTGVPDLNPGDWIPVFQVIQYKLTVTQVVEFPGRANERVISTSTQIEVQSITNDAIASTSGSGVASVFPGVVASGTGPNYLMNVYKKGLSKPPSSVNVTQLQIDAAETIPAGSWELVVQIGSNYYVQFPVWLTVTSGF